MHELQTSFKHFLRDLVYDLAALDSQIVLLMVIVVAGVIVLDALSMSAHKAKKSSGVDAKGISTVSIDGSKTLPVRTYVSDIQGLAGKPDALICEEGYIIPVERKPLARKLHDRYVAQLLVYMRLVEEFEGKKPPYGYLILGPNCRRIRIDNTPARQAWLQNLIDQMQEVLQQKQSAKATPHPRKCRKCDVKSSCAFRADAAAEQHAASELIAVGARSPRQG